MKTIKITKKTSIKSGDKIIHNGKRWKIYTDKNEYGRERSISETKLEKAIKDGHLIRVDPDKGASWSYQRYRHYYKVKA